MKVFEVITEHCKSGKSEIITTNQYVTAEDDDILTVVEHFTEHCFEYDKNLKGVREVIVISEHIRKPEE